MQPSYDVDMRLDVGVPMRDGVTLSADIYLPDAAGSFPTVLIRTPYGNNAAPSIETGRRLANVGYACVIQDVRGRWDSDGDYYPIVNEAEDGYDTQEWVGAQPWCNGRIGTSGGSYLGIVQWASAPMRSRFLTCMTPRVICGNFHDGLVYPGGALQLSTAAMWGMMTNARTNQSIEYHNWTEALRVLPLTDIDERAGRNLDFLKDWISHPSYDRSWEEVDFEKEWGEVAAPALIMGGWYDLFIRGSLASFSALRLNGRTPEARQSRLIIGPWAHSLSQSTRTGDVDFGAGSMVDLDLLELRWLDHWLKGSGDGVVEEPPVRLFIMGINQWRNEHEWPLARTEWQKWHLHSHGNAATPLGDGALSVEAPGDEQPDRYVYDPQYPVPTMGGNLCCSPHIVPWGPYDQRPVEMRPDVLCYTSEPLGTDTEVTGPVRVVLYASTDAPDTDWTAKLVDVSPTGYAMNLCDGIVRARYRDSRSDPTLLEPGAIYRYEIDLGPTGNVFRAGHSIRVEISSSNFPHYDRNPNTGHEFGVDAETRQARQTVHHTAAHPSHIVLPVIPAG